MRTNKLFQLIQVLGAYIFCVQPTQANPSGGKVAQGNASITAQGPQLTVRQTSSFSQINWQSFNIAPGETTTFIQPTSTSIVWNQINDLNPSQILGNLNANGFVILQNPSGFFVGGQAAITAHGLIMSTAHISMPDIADGGAWQFNAPPPSAKIITYGRLDIGGGPAFLIASDIENHGTISNPGGQIGLIAGQQVLLSTSPDGRGISAQVTLPQGSVDNSGKVIADGGSILMRAQVVNQGGLVQANSIRQVNGSIELYASDAVHLNAGSSISAQGDTQGVSSGGSVVIKSDNTYSDDKTSIINISGGAQGGNGGHVEISAPHISAINSSIVGHAENGFRAGDLLIDPDNILLTDFGSTAPGNGTVNAGDPPTGSGDTLTLDVSTFNELISANQLSKISLSANYNIEVGTSSPWVLPDSSDPNASLTLNAGRNITIDDQSGIQAGRNWSINMNAGTELASAASRQQGSDGIYLNGLSILQTQNGNINLKAQNEIIVDNGVTSGLSVDGNGITTTGGGSITVAAKFGDVNTGGTTSGYDTGKVAAPYYKVSPNLGGISTAAGGDVTITAGGNITSYLPLGNSTSDGGSGAFGSKPGNVTIDAGGDVFGHYVVANGIGTVTAENGNVGAALTSQGFALSLISGSWNVNAPHGSIYLQEVRNPNGVFNNLNNPSSNPGFHMFDYSADASVTLDAASTVEITGLGIPRTGDLVPIILPPTLNVSAGAGGFILDTSVTLFPSAKGDLNITTTGGGNFVGTPDFSQNYPSLIMSDSSLRQWLDSSSFTPGDSKHRPGTPTETGNTDPVEINISGSMESINLFTTKAADIKVGRDIINCGFVGQNLSAKDKTTITVGGKIFNQPFYSFDFLRQPIVPADPLNPTWDSIFSVLVDPKLIASTKVPANITLTDLKALAALMAPSVFLVSPGSSPNPGFVYDPKSLRLGYGGIMSVATLTALTGTLEAITVGADGLPEVANGHFVTHLVTFVDPGVIADLYTQSQLVPKSPLLGFQIGGPGQFSITAASIDLGSSDGIESWGVGNLGTVDYSSLTKYTAAGASVNVEATTGDIDMVTSRIASFFGGNVTVKSDNGQMNLGSQDLFGTSPVAFGIYTSGHSDVTVTAANDININGSRIATYNGGNVTVESENGNVNAGSGGNIFVNVPLITVGKNGKPSSQEDPIYGSGIVAVSLPRNLQTSGDGVLPGNIKVTTPRGDIIAGEAGILQLALDGSLDGGPTVILSAGTPASGGNPAVPGNIDLGNFPLIGGGVSLTAQGNINALVFSRQNAIINAAQNFSGTLVSGGTANVSAGGSISGTIVGIAGVSASGGSISATLLSQNVSVGGGQAQSTLGTSATATAASQSAAQQSTADTKQQVIANSIDEDDTRKKKKGPVLQRVKRVTVILPKA